VVRGDSKVLSIAAASVLAKVARDAFMIELDVMESGFDLACNKGYGSASHRRGIMLHGPCLHHRLSWALPSLADAEVGKESRAGAGEKAEAESGADTEVGEDAARRKRFPGCKLSRGLATSGAVAWKAVEDEAQSPEPTHVSQEGQSHAR
jgi:ribonuclease HII